MIKEYRKNILKSNYHITSMFSKLILICLKSEQNISLYMYVFVSH